MDLTQVRTKLQGFGMQLLDGIDPNPDNFVCAGIVHMRAQQVGCLLRLEPNKQAQVSSLWVLGCSRHAQRLVHSRSQLRNSYCFLQMFRLTVRSSKESMSVEICDLLVDQF